MVAIAIFAIQPGEAVAGSVELGFLLSQRLGSLSIAGSL